MNEAKHTPGPWRFSRLATGGIVVYSNPPDLDTPCSEIAQLTDPDGYPAETAKANARLIAAAPDLLAACERSVAAHNADGGLCRCGPCEEARAAIAKAKGGAA